MTGEYFFGIDFLRSRRRVFDDKEISSCVNNVLSDFVVIDCRESSWSRSHQKGLNQLILERILGSEEQVVRATSLQLWNSNSNFSLNNLDSEVEIIILHGQIENNNRVYRPGSHLLAPVGSQGLFITTVGCLLYFKKKKVIRSNRQSKNVKLKLKLIPISNGINNKSSIVSLTDKSFFMRTDDEFIAPAKWFRCCVEVFVLEGCVQAGPELFGKGHWLRLPAKFPDKLNIGRGSIIFLNYESSGRDS